MSDVGGMEQASTSSAASTSSPDPFDAVPATQSKGWLDSVTGGNQFMSAGLGVMAVGAGVAVARQSVRRAAGFAKQQMLGQTIFPLTIEVPSDWFLATMEIPSKDKSYLWFLHWMSSKNSPRSRSFAVETVFKQHDNGSASTTFSLVPGPGKHWIKYRGAYIQVDRQRDGKMMDLSTGSPWETVTLTTLYRDREIFRTLLKEAQESAMKMQEGKTVIYCPSMTEWRPFGTPQLRRSLDSVVLDTGVKEGIVDDVKAFLKSGSWYRDRGIPFRRGYLLHGSAGSGKTSFIYALAGELEYNICTLNLSERGLTDGRLLHLFANVPDRSILLLEDIDAAFQGRTQTDRPGYGESNLTFAGLLNALDGVASTEERIIFMTTNHEERLDPALIRPGRADIKALLTDASDAQIKNMFLRFYEGQSELAEQFLRNIRQSGKAVSTAQLQGIFIQNKGDPKKSVDTARLYGQGQ